jgi:hypothetical protein
MNTYHQRGDEQLSQCVVEAVADTTGRDPYEMEPLYEVIDPDALDRLFNQNTVRDTKSSADCVRFRFEGCEIAVRADNQILVTPPDSNCS